MKIIRENSKFFSTKINIECFQLFFLPPTYFVKNIYPKAKIFYLYPNVSNKSLKSLIQKIYTH